jgi:hypothetical protein
MRLGAALGITLSFAFGAAEGCGVDPQGQRDEAAVAGDVQAPSALDVSRFFTVKRALCPEFRPERRQCGWIVQEVNTSARKAYVDGLDLSRVRLGTGGESLVLDAPEQELVLRGSLGRRALVVLQVFRGMPGFLGRAEGDATYAVSCATPACDSAVADRVGTPEREEISGVSVGHVLAPFVSGEWLLDRVEHHQALVAGHLTSGGLEPGVAAGKILEASQVFVGVPFASGPCPLIRHACAAPLVPAYTRDAALCRQFVACVQPGACPLWRPACAPGYRLTTWPAGDHACPAFACDPAFLGPGAGATEDGP